jgi:protein associated with RNAse G/E
MFAAFLPGQTVVVSERRRGLLWAAIPHRCITAENERLVTYLPRGTIATYASNRDLPDTRHLPRSDRKLEAMRTRVYEVVERPTGLSQLHFFVPGRYSHVNLGWADNAEFVGWYVNFELPSTPTADGLESKDLVLDLMIAPDRNWEWKDQADFDTAIDQGILSPDLRPHLIAEADRILTMSDRQDGPFDPMWTSWKPDPDWPVPQLPSAYGRKGHLWEH